MVNKVRFVMEDGGATVLTIQGLEEIPSAGDVICDNRNAAFYEVVRRELTVTDGSAPGVSVNTSWSVVVRERMAHQ